MKNMFTKQQWALFFVAAIIIIGTAFGILYTVSALVSQPEIKRQADTYAVVDQDSDGYYVALQVKETEDGHFKELSYWGEEDNVVVFLDENVRDSSVGIGEIVNISLNPYGENPVVTTFND